MKAIVFGFLCLAASSVGAVDMPTAGGAMNAVKAKGVNVMAACKEDTVSYCKEIKGMDKIKTCLKENVDKLTPSCKESVTKI